ncbi:MAG TPA: 50S ribosomal protein L4 [Candidatus Paceibacterota bacterium]
METKVYNQQGKESGSVKLPESIFGLPWDSKTERLVHQVYVAMAGNQRTPTAHTKNRGEVSGTGKKPWKQKGTGRARHGSRRSPIWVGGGVAHGPRNERDYSRKINKKMKNKALFAVLSRKFKDGEMVFLDNLLFKTPKTKEAKGIVNSLAKVKPFESINRKKNAAFIALADKDENVKKSFGNFGNLEVGEVKDLNTADVLKYRYIVIANPEKSIQTLSSRIK